jgi:hypothetical protein
MESNREGNGAARLLHVATTYDKRRKILAFVCETNPLATLRTFGLPVKCPFCQRRRPLGGAGKAGAKVGGPKAES